jgi:hypothetical protein
MLAVAEMLTVIAAFDPDAHPFAGQSADQWAAALTHVET